MNTKWPKPNADFHKINNGEIINIKNEEKLDKEFYEYALKFKKSANLITQHILEKSDISRLDTYFFTIAYLYRHSIELILKAIGFQHILELEQQKEFVKDTFHNLSEILEYISVYIENILENDRDGYQWLVDYFKDVNIIDKESDAFRYPFSISVERTEEFWGIDKKYSAKPVFDKQTHINLVAFANKLEVTFTLLESLYKNTFGSVVKYKDFNPVFLEEGGSYFGQCVVGYQFSSNDFSPYIKAYTECSEYLYKKICENKSLKGLLFIPMCYLHRNAVELSLKATLFEGCSFNFQQALKHINDKKHKILGLWKLIKNEIEEHANAPQSDTTIANVEFYINQLNDVDGSSDKFRYPTNKYLQVHFKNKRKLDIDNVNDFFCELESFLSGVNFLVSEAKRWKSEMEAEYQNDYGYDEYYYD